MPSRVWEWLLPDDYRAGQYPGESLTGEVLRRGLWKLLPGSLLKAVWTRLLLGGDRRWCFVLGVNNSGTTLLKRLLGRHPSVRTLPTEGQLLTRALTGPAEVDARRLWSTRPDIFRWTEEDDGAPAKRALHDWGFHYLFQSGTVLMEKSPPDTIRSRWLQEHFSPCRFIAMVRHPCAVAEGIRRRESHDIGAAARHWRSANRILGSDFRHLRHRTLVQYEELCENPVGTLNRLADFLSIPAEFGPTDLEELNLHSLDDDVETVENFNPRSFRRLSNDDLAVIASEAGDVAEEFGYRIPPNAHEA